MPRLRHVYVYPHGGHLDRPWHASPAVDAFVKTMHEVGELYSAALEQFEFECEVATLQAACHPSDGSVVVAEVHVDPDPYGPTIVLQMPASVASMAPRDRSLLALDTLDAVFVRLSVARGWNLADLEACRRAVEEAELTYLWDGPWKNSPNRKFRARACFRIEPDGYGRVALEISGRDGVVVARSPEAVTYASAAFHRTVAKSIRWTGSTSVSLIPREADLDDGIRFDHDAASDEWRPSVVTVRPYSPRTKGPSASAPPVEVSGVGTLAPEATPVIVVCGGGPTNDVPEAYLSALDQQLDLLASEAGQAWWQAAGIHELQVFYWFDGKRVRTATRRSDHRLTVAIERPVLATQDGYPVDLARSDVEALVAAIRRRTGLPAHPVLRSRSVGHRDE